MDRSVRQSVDPVRRGVHGPGVSVFGSPANLSERENASIECASNVKQQILDLKTT